MQTFIAHKSHIFAMQKLLLCRRVECEIGCFLEGMDLVLYYIIRFDIN